VSGRVGGKEREKIRKKEGEGREEDEDLRRKSRSLTNPTTTRNTAINNPRNYYFHYIN